MQYYFLAPNQPFFTKKLDPLSCGTIQGITQGIRQGMGPGTIHGMLGITSTGSTSTNNNNQVQQQLHHYIDGMGSHNTQAPIADRQSS
jgi:hypothetical protein